MKTCKICSTEVDENVITCELCKYPIGGAEKEQAIYVAQQVIQKSNVEQSIERLKKSRLLLFILGGFYVIAPFTPLVNTKSLFIIISSIFLGSVFVGFGFLTFKKPRIALLIPLVLTVLYYLVLLFVSPFLLFQGLLWKVIILSGLLYGYVSVRNSDKILKENPYLASVLGFSTIKGK